ncbi:MAG: hypothetical protein JSV88_04325 [Candidatus Aminicenantes bacterium]|nr:MAG: hypothetical protein JSV88_04325 [Candidatus Aminicenantes bacterium]
MKHPYTIVLTHDVDHLELRNVPFFSREAGSFIKRCIFSNFLRLFKRDINGLTYIKSFLWGISFPLIKVGLMKDPWKNSLEQILTIEEKYAVHSTFYFIPFKRTPGFTQEHTPAPSNRGADYEVNRYSNFLVTLEERRWEVGVHGINAHIGVDEARKELELFKTILPGGKKWGMQVHWLYQPENLYKHLKKAGYFYDSTFGSNDQVGFKDHRFRPFKKDGIWVLPMNIQDSTLLAHWHKNFSQQQAWKEIQTLLDTAKKQQTVVTILWHNVSFGSPRFWGNLYQKIIEAGQKDGAQFLTALEAIEKLNSPSHTEQMSEKND